MLEYRNESRAWRENTYPQLNPALSFLLHPLQRPRDLGQWVLSVEVLVAGLQVLFVLGGVGGVLNPNLDSSFLLFTLMRTHLS